MEGARDTTASRTRTNFQCWSYPDRTRMEATSTDCWLGHIGLPSSPSLWIPGDEVQDHRRDRGQHASGLLESFLGLDGPAFPQMFTHFHECGPGAHPLEATSQGFCLPLGSACPTSPPLSHPPDERTQPAPLVQTSLNDLKDTGNSLLFRKNLSPINPAPIRPHQGLLPENPAARNQIGVGSHWR